MITMAEQEKRKIEPTIQMGRDSMCDCSQHAYS